ncbi:MAG: hypothetical protein ACRDQ7_22680 [Haloechinothrix sp.]
MDGHSIALLVAAAVLGVALGYGFSLLLVPARSKLKPTEHPDTVGPVDMWFAHDSASRRGASATEGGVAS